MGGKKSGSDTGGRQALYRRYRSTSFDELVGQEHVTDLLKAAVKNGTFSHAYLFTGQRGTGKTSAARILAYAINDLPYDADAGHLDIIEIDAASNRRIDDIRDLREKVFIAPVSAKYKVYIIDEVHMLTGESFNALLKTLEEPPEHAVFILATTELHKVPATIVSRTQRFHFRPVSLEKVVAHLASIAQQENIDIDEEALKLIAEHGGGSFRDSISLLDQLGSLEGKVTTETVESVLGRARSTDIGRIIQALESNDQPALHALLYDMLAQGTSPVTLAEQLVATILRQPDTNSRWYELTEKLMSVPRAHFPELLLVSTLLGFASREDNSRQPTADRGEQEGREAQTEIGRAEERKSGEEDIRSEILDLRKSQGDEKSHDGSGESSHAERETNGSETQPVTTSASFNWDNVLAATKKTNPALHAVLSRAVVDMDGKTLGLSFQYALHRKKLDQAQYRTQLLRVIQDVCGLNPEIVIRGTEQPTGDDTTKKVADIMGGGEVVQA